MKIKGSTVVITGASSGIGRAAALEFAKHGANVVLAARRKSALEDVARQIREYNGRALVVPTDTSDADAVDHLADRAAASFGSIDIWVNNAAVSLFGPLHKTPARDFQRVLETNVMGYVHGAQAALKHFRRQRSGVLINVSSVVGEVPQPLTAAYSASKAAINSLSVSIRSELMLDGYKNVHVATVLPPTVDTPLFDLVGNYTGKRVVPMPPIYPAQKVAEAIVSGARKPQHEIPVGAAGKELMMSHRKAPASAEKVMAHSVNKKHLSKDSRRDTTGNLYEPLSHAVAAVDGGWEGKTRHNRRKGMGIGAGTVVLGGVALGTGVLGAKVLGKVSVPKVIAAKLAYSGAKKASNRVRGRKR